MSNSDTLLRLRDRIVSLRESNHELTRGLIRLDQSLDPYRENIEGSEAVRERLHREQAHVRKELLEKEEELKTAIEMLSPVELYRVLPAAVRSSSGCAPYDAS